MLRISFVIPAYNEEALIGQCLTALTRECERAGHTEEIIVVDNASTDSTAAIAASFPRVTVLKEAQKGVAHARQTGSRTARGDLIANIDADTRMQTGWIDMVLSEFSAHPQLVALSGPYFFYDLPIIVRGATRLFYYAAKVAYIVNCKIFRFGSVLQAGNLVVRRDAFQKIGGFDTSIEFYGEDADLARRMITLGDVKWMHRFSIPSSGRRIAHEGIFTMGYVYTMTYLTAIFLKRPMAIPHRAIRPSRRDD